VRVMTETVDAASLEGERCLMRLEPECPRCPSRVTEGEAGAECVTHGPVTPLWRPGRPDYDSFAEYLLRADHLPTWLPWPLAPGWQVTDFGLVGAEGRTARAAFAACAGPSELDGLAQLTVVTEEPGVGLGARVAGVPFTDPGQDTVAGPPTARLRIDGSSAPVWAVSTSDAPGDLDRSVFAGEAQGRWLWLVLRPASAALLLQDIGALQDISGLGPELVTLPFGDLSRWW
jgi:hypothetical protein